MANVEKLEAVLDYIRQHPEEHDQGTWAETNACGTTLCFAGTAVVLAGYRVAWKEWDTEAYLCLPPGDEADEFERIDEVAKRILDLDDYQAKRLLLNSETFDDVERVVKDIINEQAP